MFMLCAGLSSRCTFRHVRGSAGRNGGRRGPCCGSSPIVILCRPRHPSDCPMLVSGLFAARAECVAGMFEAPTRTGTFLRSAANRKARSGRCGTGRLPARSGVQPAERLARKLGRSRRQRAGLRGRPVRRPQDRLARWGTSRGSVRISHDHGIMDGHRSRSSRAILPYRPQRAPSAS